MRMLTNAPVHKSIALVAITRSGLEVALRLQRELSTDYVAIYASQRALKTQGLSAQDAGENDSRYTITSFETVGPLLAHLWRTTNQIVLIFALGAAIRLIAPLLQDKHTDPGVVVIDDVGRFAISVVAGHMGEANSLAKQCADVLGAIPVVTTASDMHNTLAADLLGRNLGWQIEDASHMTAVSASIINSETVAILQEVGKLDWLGCEQPWPKNLTRVSNLKDVSSSTFTALLVISDRVMEELPKGLPSVVYRPPTLVLGVGCRRGISFNSLDAFIKETLAVHRLAFKSIAVLATAEIKKDEFALQKLAEQYRWSFEVHPVEALNLMTPIPNPSERVQKLVGTPSVCEAAALLSSEGGELVVCKHKGEGMTVAVARRSTWAHGRSIPGIASDHVAEKIPTRVNPADGRQEIA
jgi:cobalt-precorrin 5A hydrolase